MTPEQRAELRQRMATYSRWVELARDIPEERENAARAVRELHRQMLEIFPALLDALEAAERERDEAKARVDAALELCTHSWNYYTADDFAKDMCDKLAPL